MTSRPEAYARKLLSGDNLDRTRKELAIESGYSPKTPTTNIEQSQKFQQILITACPDQLIRAKLLEGLSCDKHIHNTKGELLATVPDNANRLRALEITLKLRNLFPKEQAETNANNLSAWLNGIKAQRLSDIPRPLNLNTINVLQSIDPDISTSH